jgi:hypothetical protein
MNYSGQVRSCAGPTSDEEVVIALAGFDKKAIGPGCGRKEAPTSEEVKFIRGNNRINRPAARPDIAAEARDLGALSPAGWASRLQAPRFT